MRIDLDQLRQAIRSLRIPSPSAKTTGDIFRYEGMALVHQLSAATGGDLNATASIRGVILACHDSTVERLARGRLSAPSFEALIAIGKSEGAQFGRRVRKWETDGFPDDEESRYVSQTLERFSRGEPASADSMRAEVMSLRRSSRPNHPKLFNVLAYRPGRGLPRPPRGTSDHEQNATSATLVV